MTVVPLMQFQKLSRLQSYEELQAILEHDVDEDVIVSFVSHQWLSFRSPDPYGVQLLAAQRIFQALLDGRAQEIMSEGDWRVWSGVAANLAAAYEGFTEKDARFQSKEFTAQSLSNEMAESYVWLDYFSIPQTDKKALHKAVQSIPRYIERCSFFFVVAPQSRHEDTGDVCDLETWRTRGWCRLEMWANYLAIEHLCPIVITEKETVMVESNLDFKVFRGATREGAVGCGQFSCCSFGHRVGDQTFPCDKEVCLSILRRMWVNKWRWAMESETRLVMRYLALFSFHMSAEHSEAPFNGGPLIDDSSDAEGALSFRVLNARLNESLPQTRLRPLCLAANAGSAGILRALLAEGEDPRGRDVAKRTALERAALVGSEEAIDVLLGAAPDFVDDAATEGERITPLMRAAGQGHLRVVAALVSAGSSVDLPRLDTGETALHMASQRGRAGCVAKLLAARADANARDLDGRTPLHHAATGRGLLDSFEGKPEVAKLLIEAGADISAKDKQGRTARDVANIDEGHELLRREAMPPGGPAEARKEAPAEARKERANCRWGALHSRVALSRGPSSLSSSSSSSLPSTSSHFRFSWVTVRACSCRERACVDEVRRSLALRLSAKGCAGVRAASPKRGM